MVALGFLQIQATRGLSSQDLVPLTVGGAVHGSRVSLGPARMCPTIRVKRASSALRIRIGITREKLRCRSTYYVQVDAAQATLQGAVRAASCAFTTQMSQSKCVRAKANH